MALTQKEYVNELGSHCPKCDGDSIVATHGIDVFTIDAYQKIQCNDCGARWTDVYELKGYEDLED